MHIQTKHSNCSNLTACGVEPASPGRRLLSRSLGYHRSPWRMNKNFSICSLTLGSDSHQRPSPISFLLGLTFYQPKPQEALKQSWSVEWELYMASAAADFYVIISQRQSSQGPRAGLHVPRLTNSTERSRLTSCRRPSASPDMSEPCLHGSKKV